MSAIPISNQTPLYPPDINLIEFYNINAPAFYGEIVRIVACKEIADRVLAKSFTDIINNNIVTQQCLTPFTNVMNHCRKKSHQTLKAIKIFQACAYGETNNLPAPNQ